ncbi:MAG: hypothetical protein BWZ01_03071 [Deltaproteobacteria bacterium ADurb.BinA179]|nr:MAG: hypothetical protein BWZ01_03071 [Deltaproteobacteria bacterium ADurb.BinA179]
MELYSQGSSSNGGVFQGWQCDPISHLPESRIFFRIATESLSVATW